MSNRKKNRIFKKRIKRIAIVGAPIILLCVISYASIMSLLHASDSTFAFEQFHENAGDTSEGNSGLGGGDDVDNNSDEVTEVITNHDDLVPDTDPSSLTVLVNKELSLPSDYAPEDLVVPDVPFSINYEDEKKYLREAAANALEDLFQGANGDSIYLTAVSGYRSYDRQYEIFTSNIKNKGLTHTLEYSAIPGYSEHQTGLAIDVSAESVNNRLDASLADSSEGKWLAAHAYEYGYIIRYPEDKVELTGYSYEPWHIRYVGKALAKYLYDNNLCLEEYYNFTYSKDYADITLDTLVSDYGIEMSDIVKPTWVPTKAPVQVAEDNDTAEEDTSEDTIDTVDTEEPSKEDGRTTDDSKDTDNTSEGSKGDSGSKGGTKPHATPTVTPVVTDPDSQTSDSTETNTEEEDTANTDSTDNVTPTPSVIPE